ncbi:MAG: hypothetical protein RMK92_04005, partial [Armatimonadota bacterium]|nr:hypothetical protein [Armatimonadota bacterium]
MKRFVLFGLVAGLALLVNSAWAVVVVDYKTGAILSGSATIGNASWVANEDGNPWWDNRSADTGGPNGNIGHVLTGVAVPGFSPNQLIPSPGNLPYLYDGSGPSADTKKAVVDWVFQDGLSVGLLRLELAGNRNFNEFGIYKAGDKNTKKKLFSGSDVPPKAVSFNPVADLGSTQFGLYMKYERDGSGWIFYSESKFNEYIGSQPSWWVDTVEQGYQHFALFQGAWNGIGYRWWIGVEDKPYGNNPNENNPNNANRGDYQD